MNQNTNAFPLLQETEPDSMYRKRITYGKRFLVWITCTLIGTFLVGLVLVGLFAPSVIWIVFVACGMELLVAMVIFALMLYWAFRDFQSSHSEQRVLGIETKHIATDKFPTVVEGQVIRVTEVKDTPLS